MALINLVSHLPLAVSLSEPHPDPEHPGNSPELRSIVVPGKSHPDSRPMVTRGIDEDVFNAWKGVNANHPWLKDERLQVVSDEDADKIENDPLCYGFEPGLENVDMTGADEGSLEGEKRAHEIDMTAYSNVPNDDSPRSQTRGMPQVVPSAQPMDPEPSPRGGAVKTGDSPHEPVKEPVHDHMSEAEMEKATRPADREPTPGSVEPHKPVE